MLRLKPSKHIHRALRKSFHRDGLGCTENNYKLATHLEVGSVSSPLRLNRFWIHGPIDDGRRGFLLVSHWSPESLSSSQFLMAQQQSPGEDVG